LNNHQVLQYDTAGCLCDSAFLRDYTGNDYAGGEGLACVGSGGTGQLITSNTLSELNVFNLLSGVWSMTSSLTVTGAGFTALSVNALGTQLYAADYGGGNLDLMNLNPLSQPVTKMSSTYKHDVAVGYSGYIFATDFAASPGNAPGVEEYNTDLSLVGNYIPNQCWTFVNGDGQSHCTSSLSGMAWDSNGNLWVSSDATLSNGTRDHGIFEFAVSPTGVLGNGGVPLNFTPDTSCTLHGSGNCLPIGLTVAPPGVLDYAGNIIVANFSGDTVVRIDPTTCSGNLGNGGLGKCTLSSFITGPSGSAPKYPVYTQSCPNPENDGYVEICKAANTQFPPPSQLYDFTVSGPFFSSGPTPIQVPLGECSGPVQVPSATLQNPDTITESPVLGVLVSDVTALAYNSLGMQINQLANWISPDLNASVGVQAGDVSLETIATFTNYAVGQDGQLKVCKIAGPGTPVGTVFMFSATGVPNFPLEAGPPDQGGYCALVNTYQVNTPVTITEIYSPMHPYHVPPNGITVECDGCTYNITIPSVTTTIGAGITEVDFTNVPNMAPICNPNASLIQNGGFDTGSFSGWTTGGNFEDTEVVSGAFYDYSGAQSFPYYAVLGPVGADATLSQTFTTVPYQDYAFCFWFASVGDSPSDFTAEWDGNPVLMLINPNTGVSWTEYTFYEQGTGSDSITFKFRDDPGYMALDSVAVSP
jgi:hypothetical protein